jgi:hypothetical protein
MAGERDNSYWFVYKEGVGNIRRKYGKYQHYPIEGSPSTGE